MAGHQSEDQPEADRRLAEGLKRREHLAVRQDRPLEEVLVPFDGVPGGELGDPLGVEGDEARGDRRVRDQVPEEREGELGPHRFHEPHTDDDPQQNDPAVRVDHGRHAKGRRERGQLFLGGLVPGDPRKR